MPSKAQQRKAAEKQRYAQNKEKKKEERKIRYRENIEKEKLYSQEYHKNNALYRNLHERKIYINDIEGKKKEASRIASHKSYMEDPDKKKEASRIASRKSYMKDPDKKKEASCKSYMEDPDKKKEASRKSYMENPDKKKEASHKSYMEDPDKKKEASRKSYMEDPDKKKEASRIASRKSYMEDPNKKKKALRKIYYKRRDQKCLASRQYYYKNKKLISVRRKHQRFLRTGLPVLKKHQVLSNLKKCISGNRILASKLKKSWERSLKVPNIGQSENKACSSKTVRVKKVIGRKVPTSNKKTFSFKCKILKQKKVISKQVKHRRKCSLKNPSVLQKQKALRSLKKTISHSRILKSQFRRLYANCADCTVDLSKKGKSINKAIANYVASHTLNKNLNLRKENVDKYLKSIKDICKFDLDGAIKEHSHSVHTEPYFYEASYLDSNQQFLKHFEHICKLDIDAITVDCSCSTEPFLYKVMKPIPIDQYGRCVIADIQEQGKLPSDRPKKWGCTSECKNLTKEEYDIILDSKKRFSDDSVQNVHNMLMCIDECPHSKHPKYNVGIHEDMGVEKMGHSILCTDGSCKSPLRLLKQACTHHSNISPLLRSIYSARCASNFISDVDTAMNKGDIQKLMKLGQCENVFEEPFEADNVTSSGCNTVLLHNETEIQKRYMVVIDNYQSKVTDDHEFACLCCERLFNKQYCTGPFSLNKDKYNTPSYQALKDYIRKVDPNADHKLYYVCKYCQPLLLRDKMPNRCVLNGLKTDPIPKELANLSPFCKQLIQKVKPFQTVVRLGTYMGKVPKYNTLKACKGTMFFLPLPLDNTKCVVEEALKSSTLPDPEVFIIVNGKPTKNKVVWRELINVEGVKKALTKLTEINWLYHNVDKDCIDNALRKIMESTSNISNKMLEKATKVDIDAFQSYTVRSLEEKQTTGTDIDQYKLLNIRDDPIDNRQKYLDVMCFPTLFPTGSFGAHHDRSVSISQSEYAKSRLLNKDSRFRKDAQYVFYLYWQKELRDLNSGIYNLLRNAGNTEMRVSELLRQVESSDQKLEVNLSTVLQSIRGTKQFWNLKRGNLNCMCREYGPPTLFMTFSCAEYDSEDIERYLRKVNDVSPGYSHNKLCVEDPISVSRKFSQQFHAWQVLGEITHYFWKKEYQARGAPHYHMVVWIDGAPVVGVDDPETVTKFIDERIMCKLPCEKENPTLYRLITKYNSHVCNNYCRRARKVNGKFIIQCRFLFPRPVSNVTRLFNVDECLKSRKTLYDLARTSEETRINSYNPLLMLLWKANMDIQYIAESSGALCNYISGYITKAEKSHMQETWEEIASNKGIYSRLFSFGVRSLRSRECGLYEASDVLLGDHLFGKSVEVQWVNVNQPEKRKRRIKKYSQLKDIAESNPNSTYIFEPSLIDDHYPNRPSELESVCLHEYVSAFNRVKRLGVTMTVPRNKRVLVDHIVYNPDKEEQKDSYYYSLLLLFVPFRKESDLVPQSQTSEMAFNLHVASNVAMQEHHEKLTKTLQCRKKIQDLNEARAKDPNVPQDCDDKEKEMLDEGLQVVGQATDAMQDLRDMMDACVNPILALSDRINMLNVDQRRVFDKISAHLNHQKLHESKQCSCADYKPFLMFVSGVGGTGKSFLIEAIKAQVAEMWNKDDPDVVTCAVATPTGLAAFNVGGVTVHRLFQLPVEHSKKAEYWSLKNNAQKEMRNALHSVKLIIIDEISMLSNLNFHYVHKRLDALFNRDEWFGGINMLFVGDLLQLSPVNADPVFVSLDTKTTASKLGVIGSVNIWRDNVVYDELTINERQKSDGTFTSMLEEVRLGNVSEASLQLLQGRVIHTTVKDKFLELQSSGNAPVCMFPLKKDCAAFNEEMLNSLVTDRVKIQELPCMDAIEETMGNVKWNAKAAKQLESLNQDCNKTAGLEYVLRLAVGTRVMLRRNIDTSKGLVNGAIGTVLSITTEVVKVLFDKMTEPYEVEKVNSKFVVMRTFYVSRRQFPLTLAFAITVHKCQGLSLNSALMDLSQKVFASGMAYVALSRVRTLEGVHLINFNKESIIVSGDSLREVNRLRKQYRPDLPTYSIPKHAQYHKLTGHLMVSEPDIKPPSSKKSRLGIKCAPKRPLASADSAKSAKKLRIDDGSNKKCSRKRKLVDNVSKQSKKVCFDKAAPKDDDLLITGVYPPGMVQIDANFIYNPGNATTQKFWCGVLNLTYKKPVRPRLGSPTTPLMRPNRVSDVPSDGNCLFSAFSYVITGSILQQGAVRAAIVAHMYNIEDYLRGGWFPQEYRTAREYIAGAKMDVDKEWGTDCEIITMAELLSTNIYSFNAQVGSWTPYNARGADATGPSIYLKFVNGNHFQVVTSIT